MRIRLLEEKIKINENALSQQKEERMGKFEEEQKARYRIENEKNELIRKNKVLESRV